MKFAYTSTIYLPQTLSLNASLHLSTPLLLVEICWHLLPFMIQILKDTNLNQKCKLTKGAVHVVELDLSKKESRKKSSVTLPCLNSYNLYMK